MTPGAQRRLSPSAITPPSLPTLLLRLALDPGIAEVVLGDLHEEFLERAALEGRGAAKRWYWKQAISSSAGGRRGLPSAGSPRRQPRRTKSSFMDSLMQDLRTTLRSLALQPGFTAVAVVTLALGIGATTGVFSLVDWLLLRPVPGVTDQHRLAIVKLGIAFEGGGLRVARLSYPNLQDLSGRLTQVAGFAGYQRGTINGSLGEEGAVPLRTEYVSSSYARVLGVEAQLGRWFAVDEDDPAAAARVAVISDSTWKGMFGADPAVVGRDLLVNGRPFEVIGVAPPGFQSALPRDGVQLWLPGASYPWANHYESSMDYSERGSGGFYEFVARAADGASWEQVQAELSAAATWLAERYPEDNAKFAPRDGSEAVEFYVHPGIGTDPGVRPYIRSTLRLMLGVVALVLLIACANVANLLVVRGMRRSGEIAVRKSLGAGRWRLVRQQLTEAGLLWTLGGAAGLGVALLLTWLFAGTQLVGATLATVPIDLRILSFAAGLSLATGLFFSLIPAWLSARVDPARTLQSGADGTRGRGRRLQTVFGAAQIAAALTLLVGALLFARTVVNLGRVDPGIDPTNVTATNLYPGDIGYSAEEVEQYFRRLREALEAHPGTRSVALTSSVPFFGFKRYDRARDAEDPEGDFVEPLLYWVTEDYFDMLSIPVLRGRTFTADDIRSEARVAVIDAAMARAVFGDAEPLGRSLEVPAYQGDPTFYEVIGVVGNTHFYDVAAAPEPSYYVPPTRTGGGIALVETGPGADGAQILRSTVAEISPSLSPRGTASLTAAMHDRMSQSVMLGRLLGVLAAVAAVLAAVGLFAMIAAGTAQRTFELGVRVALGSTPARIVGRVMAGTVSVFALGLMFGLFGAWSLSRSIGSRLYGIEPLDPASWLMAILLLAAATLIAALIPAWRASRLDPVDTLRAR